MQKTNANEIRITITVLSVYLFASSSFIAATVQGYVILYSMMLSSVFMYICIGNINKVATRFLYVSVPIVCAVVTTIVVSGDYKAMFIWIAVCMAAYMFVSNCDVMKFIDVYITTMLYIALWSLVVYVISLVWPNVIYMFPLVVNKTEYSAYNTGLAVVWMDSVPRRNPGPFWEPGAYQFFLNMALFMVLYYKKSPSTFCVYVFVAAIITTLSPVGYWGCALLCSLYVLINYKYNTELAKRLFVMLICIAAIITYVVQNYSNVSWHLVDKANIMAESDIRYGSVAARVESARLAINMIKEYPILGAGSNMREHADENSRFMTATPLNWWAIWGVFIGVLANMGVWYWAKSAHYNTVCRIALFSILLVISSNEYWNNNVFYVILIMYGFVLRSIFNGAVCNGQKSVYS